MNKKINYFYGIDFLRWVAAMAIVFYHYLVHFKITELDNNFFLDYLVMKREFAPTFVWLFWAISGFVFTNIYLKRDITFKNFFVARFARLYPLHFVTLIIVSVLQFISVIVFDHTQEHTNSLIVYDLYHFILNIFFASNWGFETAWSFNLPVWSVSIEVPIYFLFFSLLFFIRKFKYLTPLFIIFFVYFIFSPLVGLLNSGDLNGSFQLMALMNFSWCIFYFFIGSFIFFFYSKFRKYPKILLISNLLSIITCIVFINLDYFKFNNLTNLFPSTLVLFFSLILFFASIDDSFPNFFKKFKIISTTSYSVYLFHFPIQLVMLIMFEMFSLDFFLFKNYLFFLLFIMILQYISIISFKHLETPLRKKIIFRYK